MAFDKTPSTWMTGYAYASDQITLNTAGHGTPLLDELTAADANATTGDVREIFYALCAMMHVEWERIKEVSEEDLPGKMTVTRNESLTSSGDLRRQFTLSFDVAVTAGDVADE